jgi:hypothetical protein
LLVSDNPEPGYRLMGRRASTEATNDGKDIASLLKSFSSAPVSVGGLRFFVNRKDYQGVTLTVCFICKWEWYYNGIIRAYKIPPQPPFAKGGSFGELPDEN